MTTEALVAEAAKLMDKEKPGWEENINFDKIVMHDETRCIAGQNGLSYAKLSGKLHKRTGEIASDDFLFPFGGNPHVVPHWKREVEARLAHPVEVKVRLRDKAMLALSACFH